jgi:hypothetical protein
MPAKAASKSSASKRPAVEQEPPPPEEDENEEPEEEESEETIAARKKATTRRRKKAKLVGYRSLARAAGYVDRSIQEGVVNGGGDSIHSLISIAESKRLMRFVPATPGAITFSANEFKKRLNLFKTSVPTSAARETQARCDVVMRSVINEAVARTIEGGKKTVSASTVAAVLRPYAANLELTAVAPPRGLVRYAQDAGILESHEADVKERLEDKKAANANKKLFAEFAELEQKRMEELRAKRAAKVKNMEDMSKEAEKVVKDA